MIKKSIAVILVLMLSAAPLYAQSFSIKGYTYVPLWSVCQDNGIEFLWDSFGRTATLKKDDIEVKLRINSDKALVGSRYKDIGPPVRFYEGMVVVPKSFGTKSIPEIFKVPSARHAKKTYPSGKITNKIKRIVIDPGHGGKDPGAVGRYGLKEKDVILDISKRLTKILRHNGIEIILTRSTDVFIPLWKRSDIANKKQANLFISVHANAHRKRWVRGFEAYHLADATGDIARATEAAENNSIKFEKDNISRYSSDAEAIVCDLNLYENKRVSFDLAEYICKSAKRKLYIRDRGVKGARFHVLKNTNMPAVLVEVGFVSNRKEESLLKSSSYREKIAKAVANGVLYYKDEYEKTNGFTR